MKRETFVTLMQTVLSEADSDLLREAEGLLFWRKRELRAMRVQEYASMLGQQIAYLAADGKTVCVGWIDHLNRYSITVKTEHKETGYNLKIVPIERVVSHPQATDWRHFDAAVERSIGSLRGPTGEAPTGWLQREPDAGGDQGTHPSLTTHSEGDTSKAAKGRAALPLGGEAKQRPLPNE